jgi:hypothetical protein
VVAGPVTPGVLSAVALLVAAAALATLLVQPRRAWRDAAEHSRAFWVAWLLVGTGVGLAGPAAVGVSSWGGAAWLGFWAAVGSVQPSMIGDVLEMRRLERRRRQPSTPAALTEPPLRPIRWRAPAQDETAAGRPPVPARSERLTA